MKHEWNGARLMYLGPNLPQIKFAPEYEANPLLGGKRFDFTPRQNYRSPFINGRSGKHTVNVTVGPLRTAYDFGKVW